MKRKGMAQVTNLQSDEGLLIEQCRHGDSVSMECLILRYQSRIYNVILKMCGNPEDAAELTQDTFVKVIENLDRFEKRSGFYTWAFRIAVNLTINFCKRNVKLGFKSLDAAEFGDGQQGRAALKEILSGDSNSDPMKVAAGKEVNELVLRSMMRLDETQRTMIILRDIEGMDYAQIAEVLEIELGTVKSRLSRARSNLREILEAVL
jgi:RNA polymerase sigma-70 factor, ECF subfamily